MNFKRKLKRQPWTKLSCSERVGLRKHAKKKFNSGKPVSQQRHEFSVAEVIALNG